MSEQTKDVSCQQRGLDLTNLEKMRVMEWFQYIRSTNPAHLDEKDFAIAKKIREQMLAEGNLGSSDYRVEDE